MIKRIFQLILSLILLAGLGWLLFVAVQMAITLLTSLQADTAKAIVVATITAAAGFSGLLYQKHAERKKELEFRLREKKIEVYNELMSLFFDFLKQPTVHQNGPELSPEWHSRFIDLARQIILWGSDETVKRYAMFRTSGGKSSWAPNWSNLLLAMRKDLGHKNIQLSQNDLLRVFINDVDNLNQERPRDSDNEPDKSRSASRTRA